MRAVVIDKPGSLAVTELPDPEPGPRDVVVRVTAVGICGTDLHVLDGDFAPTRYPLVPGHEASGEVVDVGRDVTELTPGDRVAVDPTLTCGECEFCRVGRGNLCEHWNGMGVARTNGATAEFVSAPVRNVHRLPEHVDLAEAAIVEPLSCAVRGFDLLPRRLAEHYLIYGAGTMGLLMAQLAPRAGAASVSVVDLKPERLALARELGVDAVAASADELHRPGGWEVVIDCTGAVPAIEDGMTRVRRGGTFQQFGVASADASAAFSPFRVYNDELHVVGSMAVLHSYGRAVELFSMGAIDTTSMISHQLPLDRYSEAVDLFRQSTGRKIQIHPNR